MKKIVLMISVALCVVLLSGCEFEGSARAIDTSNTLSIANNLQAKQPTPTDIEYSLERYNLIRRAYWVNGQREKAVALVSAVQKPLGYVVLLTEGGSVVGSFIVDGKLSSLNSFLTPDSEYYERDVVGGNEWLPDVDGSYGDNDSGIFFFTPQGQYVEWNGKYLYSDIPFQVDDPVVKYEVVANVGK